MEHLHITNTLTKRRERFEPLDPPHVYMYVCGPTVYGDPHLGHSRPAITFDVVYRYLQYLGYKVRFVQNITDVGHLVNDADEGEDKLQKKALAERLEPMEVAQYYTNRYQDFMAQLNVRRPSIEPRASGHIPEQIAMVEEIMKNGYAYEVNGSVYFDTQAYSEKFPYGALSGRNLEDLKAGEGGRISEGHVQEKKHPADFALWKKAPPEHIMKWESPWSVGFPGWHIECTVMSTKYLGKKYDIHGGGMDLIFPHHEAEICQSNACINDPDSPHLNEANFWIHNNMITINGQKMGKSLGNFITLDELFSGGSSVLDQAYSPMTVRFFILQAHYGGTQDFSNEALQASEKAFTRLSEAHHRLNQLHFKAGMPQEADPEKEALLVNFRKTAEAAMNDDFNTCKTIAAMFEVSPIINEIAAGKPLPASPDVLHDFREAFNTFFTDVLGLIPEVKEGSVDSMTEELMELIIEIRKSAREEKNWGLSDKIRDKLAEMKVTLKDTAHGTDWKVEA